MSVGGVRAAGAAFLTQGRRFAANVRWNGLPERP